MAVAKSQLRSVTSQNVGSHLFAGWSTVAHSVVMSVFFANYWTSSGVESGRQSHGRRFLAPLAITMMIVFAGWLVYYPPRSTPAARLRVATFIAMVCSLVFLFVGVIMVDMKSGGFFGLVFMPLGTVG